MGYLAGDLSFIGLDLARQGHRFDRRSAFSLPHFHGLNIGQLDGFGSHLQYQGGAGVRVSDGNEVHTADRAFPRFVLPDLGMHRTGIYLLCSVLMFGRFTRSHGRRPAEPKVSGAQAEQGGEGGNENDIPIFHGGRFRIKV